MLELGSYAHFRCPKKSICILESSILDSSFTGVAPKIPFLPAMFLNNLLPLGLGDLRLVPNLGYSLY